MGHKKPARANRVGVWVKREKDPEAREVSEHESKWFAGYNQYSQCLEEDWKIRDAVDQIYGTKAGISRTKVSRKADTIIVDIYSIRPANILGRDNQRIDDLNAKLKKALKGKFEVNVHEANYSDPKIIAERIAFDLEKRIAFRKACKTAISKAMSNNEVIGIKVMVSGRLNGAEIARSEWYLEGKVPLHTLHANIDNGFAEADTTYGKIGVKITVHRTPNVGYARIGSENRRDNRDRKPRKPREAAAA